MVGVVRMQRISDCAKEIHLKIVLGHPGVNGPLRAVALPVGHHRGNLGIAFHAHVGIHHAAVHDPVERVGGRSHGNPNPYNEPAFSVMQPLELDQRDILNRFGLLVTLEMLRSMSSADASGIPSTAPSSLAPRSMLPPCLLANEQIATNVS